MPTEPGEQTQTDAEVIVRIARGLDPIEGWVTDEGGATSAFYGWLELTAALEAARRGPVQPS